MDITGFFESVSEIQVFRVFKSLGYQELVAFELARISAISPGQLGPRRFDRAWHINKRNKNIPSYAQEVLGYLPVLPSKLFESMAMGVPIILGVEGASRELIERANAGICIEPEDGEQLAQAVLELAENKKRRKLLGTNGKKYVATFHDRAKLAEHYEKLLLSLVV